MRKISSFSVDLPKAARQFVQLQTFFTGMSAILTLFVNTFLLNAFGSFSVQVLLYNAVLALVQPVAMLTALWLARRRGVLFTQRVGFVFYGATLTALCVFAEAASGFYPLFAVLLSFGAGYYYTVYSAQMLTYTRDGNRDLIAGLCGFLGNVISVLMPLLSGFLISRMGSRIGYSVVFGIAALLAGCSLLTTRTMPPIALNGQTGALRYAAKTIFSRSKGWLIMTASGLSDCRTFTLPIFVTLLFYNLVPDELLISVNSTVGYVVALLGAAVYGRFVRPDSRVKASVVAAVTVMISCLGILLGMNVTVILLFQAVSGFFNTFLATPVLNTHFKYMESLGLGGAYGPEVHLLRELFVSSGRVLGLLLVWIVPKTNTGAVCVMVCVMLTALINALILKTVNKGDSFAKSAV